MRVKRGRTTAVARSARSKRPRTARRTEPKRAVTGTPIAPPELRKRARNALRNRAAILSAAREVFNELGYGAASIRDIVRRTHLAAGTFYNYFPDKESVLRAIMDDFTYRVRARVHETRMEARTLEELVRSSFLACFRLYVEEKTLVEMMARNAGVLRLLTSQAVLEPAVEDLVADLRAKEREGIMPHLDNERVARVAVALAAELGLHMLARKSVDIESTTAFATQFMLGGIERLTGTSLGGNGREPAP
jgi:AcrR family transcriptional regulator